MKASTLVKVVGWCEVIGGAAGFLLLPITAVQQTRLGLPVDVRMPLTWYVMAAVTFGASIAAGALLLRHRAAGIAASSVIQGLQIVQFSLPGFVYQYSTGFQLLLFVNSYTVRLSPGVNAGFTALPPRVSAPWSVGVNFFAVIALVVLLRLRRRTLEPQVETFPPAV